MSSRSRIGRYLVVACAVAGMSLTGLAWPASATRISGMSGSAHDFRNSGRYTGLAAQTGREICRACHVPHHADKQSFLFVDYRKDWTDPVDLSGVAHPLVLNESVLCMSCHDGTIAAATHTDTIPDGNRAKVSLAADPHYWNDKLPVFGYAPAVPMVSQGLEAAVKQQGSQWVAISPVSATTQLPLYTDGTDPAPRMACTTCHDPHVQSYGGTGQHFLRSNQAYGDLCVTCHSNLYPR